MGNNKCHKCHQKITEKVFLMADNRTWHTSCLTCEMCCASLAITGNSLYLKDGTILCKNDYYKLLTCAACNEIVEQGSYAHKIFSSSTSFYNNKKIFYYHPSCLKCRNCQNFLKKGDKFILKSDSTVFGIFCMKCSAPEFIQDQSIPVPRKRNRQSNAQVKIKQEKLQNQNQSQFNQNVKSEF